MTAKPINRTATKREVQARQRAWLLEILEQTKLKPSQLATKAEVSSSTLTRMLNNSNYTGTLTPETVERIKETYRVPGPEEFANSRSLLLGLSEAARIDVRKEPHDLAAIVTLVIGRSNDMEAWRLRSMALDGVGYLPGDIMFVRTLADGEMPRPQDVVCAQVVDYQHGAAETVWRVYDPPFLIGASNDRTAFKPLLVDGQRVRIAGVVVQSFRPHGYSATR